MKLNAVAGGTLALTGMITDQKNSSGSPIDGVARMVTKIGAGTVVLANGSNEYRGGTIVSNGTLLVQNTSGSATGTNVVYVYGGTLGGTGQLFSAVSVAAGASLAPGGTNEVGNLTVLNSVILASGATYHVNIGATGGDKLTMIGALQLNGATLQVSLPDGFTPPAGSVHTIATGFSSLDVNGFAGLAHGQLFQAGGKVFAIRYNTTASPKTITLTPFTGTVILVR